MNTKLLLQVRDKILEEPENFQMHDWHCGTANCIGGWASIIGGGSLVSFNFPPQYILKLNDIQARRLFSEDFWPEQFKKPCTVAGQRAKQAAARILHFIETEGRE